MGHAPDQETGRNWAQRSDPDLLRKNKDGVLQTPTHARAGATQSHQLGFHTWYKRYICALVWEVCCNRKEEKTYQNEIRKDYLELEERGDGNLFLHGDIGKVSGHRKPTRKIHDGLVDPSHPDSPTLGGWEGMRDRS